MPGPNKAKYLKACNEMEENSLEEKYKKFQNRTNYLIEPTLRSQIPVVFIDEIALRIHRMLSRNRVL